jgi:hypothetical protein
MSVVLKVEMIEDVHETFSKLNWRKNSLAAMIHSDIFLTPLARMNRTCANSAFELIVFYFIIIWFVIFFSRKVCYTFSFILPIFLLQL